MSTDENDIHTRPLYVGAEEPVHLDERDVAAELGAIDPTAVPSVERPDGQPGFTERMRGAKLADHLVDAGQLPRGEGDMAVNAPDVHELVVADVLNLRTAFTPTERDRLRLIYRTQLGLAVHVRRMLLERDGA
jgi:hypothetical protein